MVKFKTLFLVVGLLLSTSFCHANNSKGDVADGSPIIIVKTNNYGGADKSSSISASVNGHTLTVVFTENLGQVTIRIFNENGTPIDLMTTPTPNGHIIYIPLAGQYTVLFSLPNGDEYWGEFEVED